MTGVVEIRLGAREGHAVVRREHDQRVIELTRLFERAENRAGLTIEPFDFKVVVEDIVADLRRVGQERGHHDRLRFQSCRRAGVLVVRTMRIGRAEPEAERLVLRRLRVEGVEAGKLRPGRIARASTGLEVARSPAFTRVSDRVAGAFEQVRIDGESRRQRAPQIASLRQLVRRASRQQRCPRRRARRRGCVRPAKQHAFAGDAIEGGRSDHLVAVHARMRIAPVVRDDDEDIGRPHACGLMGSTGCRDQHGERDGDDPERHCSAVVSHSRGGR